MSLRWRLTLVIGGVVALALFGSSFLAYVSAKNELSDQVDEFLATRSGEVELSLQVFAGSLGGSPPASAASGFSQGTLASLQRADASIQLVHTNQTSLTVVSGSELQVTDQDRAAAGSLSGQQRFFDDRRSESGEHYRVLTTTTPFGALMVGRSVDEVEQTLNGLRSWLLLISGLGAIAAACVGWFVADRVLRPVFKLAAATEQVAETRRFDADLRVEGKDELGALAKSFNSMLSALRASREQQERLVRDANHELRTPLTSLRTNVDVMVRRGETLEAVERASIIEEMSKEVRELTDLVTELVGVATSSVTLSPDAFSDVDLMTLCRQAADRTVGRTGRDVVVEGPEMAWVNGDPTGLERAIGNLLGNAVKFSPQGEQIKVVVRKESVEVHDRGPGIPEHETTRIFDRFFRSDTTRTMSGSGLGLAIVSDIASAHGGACFARNREGGGAIVGFLLSGEV